MSSTKVLAIVAEKTGYPPEMLELDLDLEADLGVDTVKQAETFAAVRETWDIPRQESLQAPRLPDARATSSSSSTTTGRTSRPRLRRASVEAKAEHRRGAAADRLCFCASASPPRRKGAGRTCDSRRRRSSRTPTGCRGACRSRRSGPRST